MYFAFFVFIKLEIIWEKCIQTQAVSPGIKYAINIITPLTVLSYLCMCYVFSHKLKNATQEKKTVLRLVLHTLIATGKS
jgi:hypothetical protein